MPPLHTAIQKEDIRSSASGCKYSGLATQSYGDMKFANLTKPCLLNNSKAAHRFGRSTIRVPAIPPGHREVTVRDNRGRFA